MREILEKLSKEKLIGFILEYAENDDKFVNAFNVHFRKPEFENELDKIRNEIDDALDDVSDYYNRDRWGYISFDVSDIIAEVKQRAEQGYIKLAFAEIELLYRKLVGMFEYQSECEVSDEAENCLDIMSEIADKAVLAEDKAHIFRQCIELSELDDGKDYGADYEDKLLKIAAKFVTRENLAELESVLTSFESGWRGESFKLIRLEIISNIEGENAADNFIAENLQSPKIREIAFEKAISSKNFSEGECLCIDALSADKQNYHYRVSPWLYKLYSVYEMMKNAPKMAETAEKILLCGDLGYYDKLKSLLTKQAVWGSSYSEILHKCELKLSYSQYMEILSKEKEYALLLEQVEKHMNEIFRYGKLLAKEYPIEVRALFTEQIKKEAEAAYGREAYRHVCSRISCFSEAGYRTEAAEIIKAFKTIYKRKPAFVDELNKSKV